jgi:hypothetical protein
MFTRAEAEEPTMSRGLRDEGRDMPQIIVTADHGAAFGEGAVMLRERVSVADFESEHFATQLVERLGWAVGDADEVERVLPERGDRVVPEAQIESGTETTEVAEAEIGRTPAPA